MSKKNTLIGLLIISFIIVFSCKDEFNNPYDTELNKPELSIPDIVGLEALNFGVISPKELEEISLSIENSGTGVLNIRNIIFEGDDSFTFSNISSFENLDILPDESKELKISFSSSNTDFYAGKLTINSDSDGDVFGSSYSIDLIAEVGENIFNGDYKITSQKEIDEFSYTSINGSLIIQESVTNNIKSLEGLKTLKSISGFFEIRGNSSLTNFKGLENLTTTNGYFLIFDNLLLENLDGLDKLSKVDGDFYIGLNLNLINIESLSGLLQVSRELVITTNGKLKNLNGLENLISVGSIKNQSSKSSIKNYPNSIVRKDSLKAIEKLTIKKPVEQRKVKVNDSDNLIITNNTQLEDFCGLLPLFRSNGLFGTTNINNNLYNPTAENLKENICSESLITSTESIELSLQSEVNNFNFEKIQGNLIISGNTINDLTPLNKLQKVTDTLRIKETSLSNLAGLSNVNEVGVLHIVNTNLQSLEGLSNLTTVKAIVIENNSQLTSIEQLSKLINLEMLTIKNNPELETLAGLGSVELITGDLTITGNSKLNDFCSLSKELFVTNGGLKGNYQVSSNNYNPTKTDLSSENCNNILVAEGDITLTTQTQVDEFNYTEVAGNLLIEGSISNLNSLSNLTKVGGYLMIRNTQNLQNLNGLDKLTTVTNYVNILNNSSLQNIEGLEKLTTVGNYLQIIQNPALTTLNGLEALTSVGSGSNGLFVQNNSTLKDFCGIRPLLQVSNGLKGSFNLSGNAYNPSRQDIEDGSCDGTTIFQGNITLTNQAQVDEFSYTEVTGNLFIQGSGISNLNSLSNLTKIGGYLIIRSNQALQNLNGLEKLTTVTNYVQISTNNSLVNIEGLEKLTTIGNYLQIIQNPALTTLNGLEALTSVGSGSNGLFVQNNSTLKDFCGIRPLLQVSNGLKGSFNLSGNAYNPSREDIEDGSCDGTTIFQGNITLTTQAQVDEFSYTEVTGNLFIQGSGISNLNSLSNLTKIGGYLIIRSNQALQNLNGLEKLTTVTNYVQISTNNSLVNIEGLEKLTTIGNYLQIIQNTALTTLNGLEALTSVGSGSNGLFVQNNSTLKDFCGLRPLLQVSGGLKGSFNLSGNAYNPSREDIEDGSCDGTTIFQGNITLTTQAQVDAFNYTEVTGNLFIQGSGISNLNSLSNLTKIGGYLIIRNNQNLQNLNPLSKLTIIEGYLSIESNPSLQNLNGLEQLTRVINYVSILNNNSLLNIEGLEKLTTVGNYLQVQQNTALTALNGLEALTSVGSGSNGLLFQNNSALKDFCGIRPLLQISGGLKGSFVMSGNAYNPTRQDIEDGSCDGATIFQGSITISTQAQLDEFNYTEITGNLLIQGSGISNLNSLSNLTKIGGYLIIRNTQNLQNLNGLEKLTTVVNYVSISSNNSLVNIEGLEKLTTISQYLQVHNNPALTTLNGLEALTSVGSGSNGLLFQSNSTLKDFCGIRPLLQISGGLKGSFVMSGNAYNPTQQDIINGNCSNTTNASIGSVIDVEGNTYKTVQIGTQIWMAENLRVAKTSSGVNLSTISWNSGSWAGLADSDDVRAVTFFNNNKNSLVGPYYTHGAAKLACPTGWRLPTVSDINTLNSYVQGQGNSNVGQSLAATSWSSGNDTYGFAALPSGYKRFDNGVLTSQDGGLYLWGAGSNGTAHGQFIYLTSSNAVVTTPGFVNKSYGFCVRCIKE